MGPILAARLPHLFYPDMYLDDAPAAFRPPEPFSAHLRRLEAPDPPEGACSKGELPGYLAACRRKCRTAIAGHEDAAANRPCGIDWLNISRGELLLYSMRHVQHHAAQLNLRLRQEAGAAPDRVARAQ